MNNEYIVFLFDKIRKESGISMAEDKMYLLENRLIPIAQQNGMLTLEELAINLKEINNKDLLEQVIDAITVNESYFFRDMKPFETLRKEIFPKLKAEGRNKVRIWCTACSTGQEPYTIAMCIREDAEKLTGMDFEIIATDICHKVLQQAEIGKYNQFEVQRGLPITMLMKNFEKRHDDWFIKDEVRQMVKFSKFNLIHDNYKNKGMFDIILCRNVLIYFEPEDKTKIVNNLISLLNPNSYFIVGASESLFSFKDKLSTFNNVSGVYIFNK